ncbi:FtsH protease activity modulator HflK [Parvibaculum sp.]|uniref:FtsH protease activity modulator HflK n=1 Tax=Parvibaculum sp. TaxID=2024848 RepID=UPI000C948E42|nr:FtsH protease activity modulator HflK [Parvibaculum sp.]MAB14878.1 FtsH protease activity modulator HflK [Parvibaculum sp.]
MPWSNENGGGGWQGGGGNRGPWGQGPSGGGGGGGNQPPDLDELLRKGQDKFKKIFPGGQGQGAGGNGRGIILILIVAVVALLAYSSVYRVNTDEQGVVLRFGKFSREVPPGLHVKLPYPIEVVYTPTVTRINRVDVGMRDTGGGKPIAVPEESLMLTGDENIVDINFSVFWRINSAENYLFNVERPDLAVKQVAESAMREAVGQSKIEFLQTTGRNDIQKQVRGYMQTALDTYGAGVEITEVKLQKVDPPSQVIDAFRDVQAARADQERLRNEAQSYANTVVPKARGEAAKITQAAEAYREQTVAEAQGEAQRFISIYDQYRNAKEVTRKRMYLETMQDVLGNTNKVVTTDQSGVLPYLPMDQLKPSAKRPSSSSSNNSSSAGSSSSN